LLAIEDSGAIPSTVYHTDMLPQAADERAAYLAPSRRFDCAWTDRRLRPWRRDARYASGGRVSLPLDGGIRRGPDILISLAVPGPVARGGRRREIADRGGSAA